MITVFLHAFLLAFGLFIPLGAQNIFVFNQGAASEKLHRMLPVIITAALCDTFLILLAVLGVSLIVLTFSWITLFIFGIGSLFLFYMAYLLWHTAPTPVTNEPQKIMPIKKQIALTASFSILNPHAILDTIGVIGTSSLAYSGTEKWVFTLTCISVSWIWFFLLAYIGRTVGQMDRTGNVTIWINKISAVILLIIGLYFFYQFILMMSE
ncbi:MAG TPA: LysE/ArgO family amino acid transporter [Massilibacterium sp.]|nr:LysE/ArgO family amino acid transporter [Massilibacterium sp.]